MPNTKLLKHKWAVPIPVGFNAVETMPLVELLQQAAAPVATVSPLQPNASSAFSVDSTPGINNHVNRLLDRISGPAGVRLSLTSHSFRRGGAQHANGDAKPSPQWIFDCGAWNLTSKGKAFAYVFNTAQEDQRVLKLLSGRGAGERIVVEGLERFNTQTAMRVPQFLALLFNFCAGMEGDQFNLYPRALDACMTRLLRAYPLLKAMRSSSPIVKRVRACADQVGLAREELLRWSVALEETCETQRNEPKE